MLQVDDLLRMEQYDIYHNNDLKISDLCEVARLFSEGNIDLQKYFHLTKFDSKFCWINIIHIITNMKYPEKLRGIPCLFEFLKDENWPVFQAAIKALISFGKEQIVPYIERYLNQAYLEGDDMWISGIHKLTLEMNILQNDFQNKDVYGLFQYGDDVKSE